MSGIERQDWECSEWQGLSEGQKAIYMAFSAPNVNNVPQMPDENTVVIAGEDYTPEDKDLVVFINGDGSLNETPDPNEIIRYTPQQRDAIKLWLTEDYDQGRFQKMKVKMNGLGLIQNVKIGMKNMNLMMVGVKWMRNGK